MRSVSCGFFTLAFLALLNSSARADDWAQWLGPKRDAVWSEKGLVTKFPKDGPDIVWRKSIAAGYAGPAVVGGKLFVMDREKADVDPKNPPPKGTIPGNERVLCMNTADGKILWKHTYDCPYAKVSYPTGPRTTPIVDGDRLFTLGTMGDLLCLNAADGTVIWAKNFVKDLKAPVPAWGWSAHLLLDGDSLIALVGGDGQAVVAFDKKTGREKWKSLTTKEICYSPPIITEAGGKRQLIVWVSEGVNSLNPETGAKYWEQKHPDVGEVTRPAVSIITPKRAGDKLLVSSFYHGTLCLTLDKDKPGATVAWRSKTSLPKPIEGLNAVMSSLIVKDGHVYGLSGMGALVCQKLETGEVVRKGDEIFGDKPAFCGSVFWVDAGAAVYGLTDQGDLVILKLAPQKCEVLASSHILEPTHAAQGRKAVWSHPAFAGKCVYMRNDKEIVCISLAAG
jgi:outer membrane protein assembly factor BamB